MAIFIVETTVDVFSPKDRKFKVEIAIKFEVETIIEVQRPKDWMFKVETTEEKCRKLLC